MGARNARTRTSKGLAFCEARGGRGSGECPAWGPGDSEVPASTGADMPTAWPKTWVTWLPPSAPDGDFKLREYCPFWVQQRSCQPEPLQQERISENWGREEREAPGKMTRAGYGITSLYHTRRDTEGSLIPRGLDFSVGETEARKLRPGELTEVSQCFVAEPRLEC